MPVVVPIDAPEGTVLVAVSDIEKVIAPSVLVAETTKLRRWAVKPESRSFPFKGSMTGAARANPEKPKNKNKKNIPARLGI